MMLIIPLPCTLALAYLRAPWCGWQRTNSMATTKFDAHFTGTAAHAGAKPEDGHNALLAAAQATLALHAIAPHSEGASRVNVGVMQAGSGRNVVPASALLKVETRGASDIAINQYVFDRAQQAIQGAATMYGVGVETRLMGCSLPPSSPSPQWVAWFAKFRRLRSRGSIRPLNVLKRLRVPKMPH